MSTNFSKKELLEQLRDLLQTSPIKKTEIDTLKQLFYKQAKIEEENNNEELKKEEEESIEKEFKELLEEWKKKKAHLHELSKKEKELNYLAKKEIITQLEQKVEELDREEKINEAVLFVRDLQQRWREIGEVAPEKNKELFRAYQLNIEKFYDYIKINNEFRDYDLKKNLEIKTALCEQAESLAENKDIITAFRELQILHKEWKDSGPVVKELREEMWERFKKASSVINKKHQEFFNEKKGEEEENLKKKYELCEQVENIDYATLSTFKSWESKTKEIIELQKVWKEIGFVPRKLSSKIYDRFRKACDSFFHEKNEFFLKAKTELVLNLDKKIALCEQAENLKESTDWRKTTEVLIQLQKDWKEIGPVPKKHSDAVWNRFVSSCDYFFEQRNKAESNEKTEQKDNLVLKTEIISKIESLEETAETAFDELQKYIEEYHQIGFVPFKDKDKILKKFKKVVEEKLKNLGLSEKEKRLSVFKASVISGIEKSTNQLFRERDKLLKELNKLKSEIAVYENNIGFFSASKKANSFIEDLNKKIDKLKKEEDLVLEKLKLLEDKL